MGRKWCAQGETASGEGNAGSGRGNRIEDGIGIKGRQIDFRPDRSQDENAARRNRLGTGGPDAVRPSAPDLGEEPGRMEQKDFLDGRDGTVEGDLAAVAHRSVAG